MVCNPKRRRASDGRENSVAPAVTGAQAIAIGDPYLFQAMGEALRSFSGPCGVTYGKCGYGRNNY